MVANEYQYRITKNAVKEFDEALARLDTAEASRPPEVRQVMREAIESQLEDLREQVTEYEALRGDTLRGR
jgi:hypothetical protein